MQRPQLRSIRSALFQHTPHFPTEICHLTRRGYLPIPIDPLLLIIGVRIGPQLQRDLRHEHTQMINAPREMKGLAPDLGQPPSSDEGAQDPLFKNHTHFVQLFRQHQQPPLHGVKRESGVFSPLRAPLALGLLKPEPQPIIQFHHKLVFRLCRRQNTRAYTTPTDQALTRRMSRHANIEEKIINPYPSLNRARH